MLYREKFPAVNFPLNPTEIWLPLPPSRLKFHLTSLPRNDVFNKLWEKQDEISRSFEYLPNYVNDFNHGKELKKNADPYYNGHYGAWPRRAINLIAVLSLEPWKIAIGQPAAVKTALALTGLVLAVLLENVDSSGIII